MHSLQFSVPEDWTNDQKGSFFEKIVADLLKPMRYKVSSRIRTTGMEIDLLAVGEDDQRRILVECKAYRDNVPAEVISKLMGNVILDDYDAGWLFSTSDLTKDGRGRYISIQSDKTKNAKFAWFSPERIIDILIDQKKITDSKHIVVNGHDASEINWTLLICPSGNFWIGQVSDNGFPKYYGVFEGKHGSLLTESEAEKIRDYIPRLETLGYLPKIQNNEQRRLIRDPIRSTVAPVTYGASWKDLRPSRPRDFVGRDDIISTIKGFIESVRDNNTTTRSFAISGPSGWGKSSLVVKISDLTNRKGRSKLAKTSITAVDSRSAINSAFVAEAIKKCFQNAISSGLIKNTTEISIEDLNYPLDSSSIKACLDELSDNSSVVVLIFDQFEELFAKAELFEIFNAVRDLSLDLDSRGLPMILGFAWKTDISHGQEHPAYFLWHELKDRRMTTAIREFEAKDITRIIHHAESEDKKRLNNVLTSRIIEQCQGYPWLLKKLLVHVFQRIEVGEAQHSLLERELDVEMLFKEDLSQLNEESIRCLRHVAANAPIAVSEVEEAFGSEISNHLINSRLLVRSGMNYVVYWDIFRDYLTDGKVPYIPWTRTFQRDPQASLQVLRALYTLGRGTSSEIKDRLDFSERATQNILTDLSSLQLIDKSGNDIYFIPSYIKEISEISLATHSAKQLTRHIIYIQLSKEWERGTEHEISEFNGIFERFHPRSSELSEKTSIVYATNLRKWLIFSGLLDIKDNHLIRPIGVGSSKGVVNLPKLGLGTFLGTSSPDTLISLLSYLKQKNGKDSADHLAKMKYRNALSDAIALGLVISGGKKGITSIFNDLDINQLTHLTASAVLRQPLILRLKDLNGGSQLSNNEESVINSIREEVNPNWADSSAKRYVSGLRRYLEWAESVNGYRQTII